MKITLRDFFWLILVVAVGLGWFAHFRSWQGENVRLKSITHEKEMKLLTDNVALQRQIGDLWKEFALREKTRDLTSP